MKTTIISLLALFSFSVADAQVMGHSKGNIEVYFGDLLEQEKWDFDKQYRWSFYMCADDVTKLEGVQKELANAGFTSFEIVPNSMGQVEGGAMLSMIVFEKTATYIPQTLLNDIDILYSLEKKYKLSNFDDYGNYELMEEVQPDGDATAINKTHIF